MLVQNYSAFVVVFVYRARTHWCVRNFMSWCVQCKTTARDNNNENAAILFFSRVIYSVPVYSFSGFSGLYVLGINGNTLIWLCWMNYYIIHYMWILRNGICIGFRSWVSRYFFLFLVSFAKNYLSLFFLLLCFVFVLWEFSCITKYVVDGTGWDICLMENTFFMIFVLL